MTIGLALSGGGARGVAHLGVMKALLEMGITFDRLSGTSAGAIVGALYAQGYSPDEILEFIESLPIRRWLRPAWNRMGLLRIDTVMPYLRQYIPHDSFEGLRLPLHIVAVDLIDGRQVWFDHGELVRPVLASCCLPGLFEPLLLNGHQYVDGGILNNLPLEPLEGNVDVIIGSHCNPYSVVRPIRSARGVIERSLILTVQSRTRIKQHRCHVFIEPPELSHYSLTNPAKARALFGIGYSYTWAMAGQIEHELLKTKPQ